MSLVWAVSSNGLLKYISVTPSHLQDVLNIMRNCFFKEESVSRAIGLNKSTEAICELNELVLDILEDGVSVIAVEEKTGRVAGSLLNKIMRNLTENWNTWKQEFEIYPTASELDKKDEKVQCAKLLHLMEASRQ
ncbi:hypothetical protein ILUMI_19180 [Ignelater luminosus]|uniref:Uncharacterized protein n=1 Tax=Ignelater luminosus TaxID=2038154 RepID=A0A8K0G648_IGNLU|nr:hypothetical protein ILUMI_19180 [Ignelater luminosus]